MIIQPLTREATSQFDLQNTIGDLTRPFFEKIELSGEVATTDRLRDSQRANVGFGHRSGSSVAATDPTLNSKATLAAVIRMAENTARLTMRSAYQMLAFKWMKEALTGLKTLTNGQG